MPGPPPTTGRRVPPNAGSYYIPGGDIVFSVEDTLFRVHSYFFTRDSSWFRDKIPHSLPPGETTKGFSDNLPLVLEDISKTEFEWFLWVFYNPKYSLYDANIEKWTSILKHAHEWSFIEVKELAIRGLEGLEVPAVQKIALYQKYEVDRNHLQAAYTTLTVRDESITIEEAVELTLETAVQLARAREHARAPRGVGNPRSPTSLTGTELDDLISGIFQLSSPSAAREHTTNTSQTSTGGGSQNASQSATQTNTNPSSNTAQGTGNPSANGPTNGSQNGHVNGTGNSTTGGQGNRRR